MADNNDTSRDRYVNEIFEKRVENALKDISGRCSTIETQLSEIIRLQERVSNHETVLTRFGNRLDSHDGRIRGTELWQADHGDKSYFVNTVNSVEKKIVHLEKKVDKIESHIDNTSGKGAVLLEILKWSAALFGAILASKIVGTI